MVHFEVKMTCFQVIVLNVQNHIQCMLIFHALSNTKTQLGPSPVRVVRVEYRARFTFSRFYNASEDPR